MTESERIIPRKIEADETFWEYTANHELRMQYCNDCGEFWWPPGPICPDCWSRNYAWKELSGEGYVNTWVVFHYPWLKEFEDQIPYNVCEIQLEEGPQYLSTVVDCDNHEIRRGMDVEVVFEDFLGAVTLPKFRPR